MFVCTTAHIQIRREIGNKVKPTGCNDCCNEILIGSVIITLGLDKVFNVLLGCIFGFDGYFFTRLKLSFKEYY